MNLSDQIKALLEGDLASGVISFGNIETEKEEEKETETIQESEEEITLTPSQFKTLRLAAIAESIINESMENLEELEAMGLMEAKKLSEKGKKAIFAYTPTILAS